MSVANACPHGAYHVLPSMHVELEPQGPPDEQGRPCRVILTCLTNTAMPMIRYDIADLAVGGIGPCPCGRSLPFLKQILGRETDIVVTPAGRYLVCHHFNNVLRDVPGICQFQVLQESPAGLRLLLHVDRNYDRATWEPRIARHLADLAGGGFGVVIQYADSIPAPPSGKRRYVISNPWQGQA